MLGATPLEGGQWSSRTPRATNAGERFAALGAVAALHAAVAGLLIFAQLHQPPPPPERILEVSFVAEAAATGAPSPPTAAPPPPPPPPEPTVITTSRATESPMVAAPVEREPTPLRPPVVQPAPPSPAPPSPAPATAAPAASAAANPGPPAPAITPPNFTAAYLNNPAPTYPMGSRRRREQGTVVLRVHVSVEGAPTEVLLDRSSGFPDLDAAALDVVKRRYRFVPAKQAGQPVEMWVKVPLEFSFKDR